MTNRQNLVISLFVAGAMGIAGAASAQVQAQNGMSVIDERRTADRLDRLENALKDLQGVVYSVEDRQNGVTNVPVSYVGTPGLGTTDTSAAAAVVAPGAEAGVSVRLSAMEAALADLTGQVEHLRFQLSQQQTALNRLSASAVQVPTATPGFGGDLSPISPSEPMKTLPVIPADASGGPTDLVGGAAPAQAGAASAPVSVTLPDDPEAAYTIAYDALLSADYPRAEAAFKAYVQKFPTASQTPEAKFLLGEVYLATGANSEAAKIFLDHVSTYKNDPRSPEAYLKLGVAFSRLDRPGEACRVFRAGQKKFPGMGQDLKRQYREASAGVSCSS
ncbi:MAG: tetratricopeptide repeat protein [Pseudomonadota bacterium]